ncbi:MAG: aminotransferase class IV [Deltaproteobacteria bacterium]|nr:aminotransferase class IV [Deltaproteobacteria bacterium]
MAEESTIAAAARLPRAVRSGEAVYDTLLGRHGRLHPAWPLHLGRLLADAERLALPALTTAQERALLAAVDAALQQDGSHPFVRLRMDLYADGPSDLRAPPSATGVALDVSVATDRVRPPAAVRVGPRLRNAADPLAGCKRAATASERLLPRHGADDVLLRDVDGMLSEATTSSLLVLFGDGAIATPWQASAPLRSTTIALLAALEPRLRFVAIAPEDLQGSAMVLLNAVAGGRPVASVDGAPLRPPEREWIDRCRALVDGGPLAERAFAALVRGDGPDWARDAIARAEAMVRRSGAGIAAFA